MLQAEESFPLTVNTVGTEGLRSPLTALIKGKVPAVESSTEQHLYLFMNLVLFSIRLVQEFLKTDSTSVITSADNKISSVFIHYLNAFWNDEYRIVCLGDLSLSLSEHIIIMRPITRVINTDFFGSVVSLSTANPPSPIDPVYWINLKAEMADKEKQMSRGRA